eukprot:13182660-Ditylum_brightwellii.AAC.1
MNGMKLRAELHVMFYLDNKELEDFVNDWSLKEEGVLIYKWKIGQDMMLDIFTKNCARPDFEICCT